MVREHGSFAAMAATPYGGLRPYGRFAYGNREKEKEEEMEMIYRFQFRETEGSVSLLSKQISEAMKNNAVRLLKVYYINHHEKEISLSSDQEMGTNAEYKIKGDAIFFNSKVVSLINNKAIVVRAIVDNDYVAESIKAPVKEAVNHPSHYNIGQFEVIDVIHDWKHGFNLGNAIKYLARAGHKDKSKYVEDLKKAIFYIQDEIKRHEKKD